MTISRIFAGAIVALLFSALPLGAACDLSCAFGRSASECHSAQASAQSSARADVMMDGMDMSAGGMSMQVGANSDSSRSVSDFPVSRAAHTSIGDMGPCERQSCGDQGAGTVRSAPDDSKQIHALLVAKATPFIAHVRPAFYDSLDEDFRYFVRTENPPTLSLRI